MTTFADIADRPRGAGHRGPVVGLRQLRHPLQGVRHARDPAHRAGEDRRRRDRARASPASRRPSPCTSRGTRSTTTRRSRTYAEDHGVGLGHDQLQHVPGRRLQARQPHPRRPAVRRKAIDHNLDCIEVMNETGSRDLKIWLADGTNYPGQGDMRARQDRLAEGLADDLRPARRGPAAGAGVQVLRAGVLPHRRPRLGHVVRALPALGERAMVCLDTGHHAPGTNIEFIVAQLLRLGKLGSFDFNSRFYADDDLIVGAADPFQLFRIMVEVIRGGGFGPDSDVALMLDQCHNIEDKIPGQIRSVLNVQEMTARALLVDTDALAAARTDRRRARRQRRSSWTPSTPTSAATSPRGARSAACPADPMRAYLASGYQAADRGRPRRRPQAGWN